jgi:hypothetical protein
MDGRRELFPCPACKKRFTYWVLRANEHPKVVCCYCKKESFPKGEPAPAATPPEPAKAP